MEFERRLHRRFVEKVFSTLGLSVEPGEESLPVERFSRALVKASAAKYPGLTHGEALRRIGFDVASKSPAAAMKTVGEAVTTLSGKLQSIGPFFEPHVTPRDEHHYVAHFDDVASLPTFFLGLFQGVTSSSRSDVQVRWTPEGLSGARYDVTVRPSLPVVLPARVETAAVQN